MRYDQAVQDFALGLLTPEAYYEALARACDGGYSSRDIERVHRVWSQDEYPGVSAVFDALDAAGVRTAVLSNTNAAHWKRLAAIDVDVVEYPNILRAGHLFASHLLGAMKPSPDVFEAVAATTGVQPARTLFFDDVEEYVSAARTSGWSAEQIDPLGDTAAQLLEWLRAYEVIPTTLASNSTR